MRLQERLQVRLQVRLLAVLPTVPRQLAPELLRAGRPRLLMAVPVRLVPQEAAPLVLKLGLQPQAEAPQK